MDDGQEAPRQFTRQLQVGFNFSPPSSPHTTAPESGAHQAFPHFPSNSKPSQNPILCRHSFITGIKPPGLAPREDLNIQVERGRAVSMCHCGSSEPPMIFFPCEKNASVAEYRVAGDIQSARGQSRAPGSQKANSISLSSRL